MKIVNQLLFPLLPCRKRVRQAGNVVLISKIKQNTKLSPSSLPFPPNHPSSDGHMTTGVVTSVKLVERHDLVLPQATTAGKMVSFPNAYTHTECKGKNCKAIKIHSSIKKKVFLPFMNAISFT